MRAAAPLPAAYSCERIRGELGDWWDYQPGGDEWPGESKPADYGVLGGTIVLLDYAAPAI
jgi:hypothetical protein